MFSFTAEHVVNTALQIAINNFSGAARSLLLLETKASTLTTRLTRLSKLIFNTKHFTPIYTWWTIPAQLTLPALQRVGSRACVSCGAAAESYCARCGVAPYCGPRCQRRDWAARHRAVCHNLARIPPPAPLRRPHSPVGQNFQRKQTNKSEDNADDKQQKRFLPHEPNARAGQQSNNNRGRQRFNNPYNRQDNKSHGSRQDSRSQDNRAPNRAPAKQPETQQSETVEEEWNIGSITQSVETSKAEPKPVHEAPTKHPVNKKSIRSVAPASDVKSVAANATNREENKPMSKPATVEDVTPGRKIVPMKCLIELLSVGDIMMLSVDNKASECRSKGRGFVCLSLQEKYESEFQTLCDDYSADCEADNAIFIPSPGESFSYFNSEDGAWYRARCLSADSAALIDGSKLVTLGPKDNLKNLPENYGGIPEFCCYLDSDKVQVGTNLKCTVISKTTGGSNVLIEDAETGASIGEGEVSRWLPEVEYPVPVSALHGGASAILEVARPGLENNSRVLLVEATELKRAFVRKSDTASQRKYDCVLHGVVLYGQEATPLKEPPQKGQLVVAMFSDGLHYRALCRRTNIKQNKYLLEYIEFGNLEIATLENIYPCPAEFDLSAHPAEASMVSLHSEVSVLTPPATEYIEKLKDAVTELVLTICNGATAAPSGAEVKLTVADTKESVNGKLNELCTPDWKKLEKSGGMLSVEAVTLMYSDLEYLELPVNGCEIEVLDISAIERATLSGCVKGEPLAKKILEELPKQMEAYCNSELGREPYLPKFEELCIAQCPPYPQWFRAVLCEQVSGAGGRVARLCYVDYGNVESVDVSVLRKMLPEFVRGLPALAHHLELRDFPKEPTQEMLTRALEYMKINPEGRGFLRVERCEKVERGMYVVDVPELIAAMMG